MAAAAGAPEQVIAALSAAVDGLLAAGWWQASGASLRAAVVSLEAQASRLEAARLRLLAEAHARGVALGTGAVSTAGWLAHEANQRPRDAVARVALAQDLAGPLAVTRAALAEAALSVEHAEVIQRAMTALRGRVDADTLAEAEAFLVDAARGLDPGQLARVARQLRARLEERGDERLAREEDAATALREVRLVQDDTGAWHLSGTLDAEGGARVVAALDPLMAPRPASEGGRDLRTGAQRRADALVQLADSTLAGAGAPGSGAGASRARITVTVPLASITDPGAPGAALGLLEGGQPVSLTTVATLACDAELVPVLVDGAGVPLDVGRTVYAFPDKIRTAILHRDGGCTFPSCTRPRAWCQIHHLTPYSQGGTTAERNGTALCGYHHRLVHRRGWQGQLTGTTITWHPPDRTAPRVPPPPWAPALDRLITRWGQRWATPRAA